MLRLYITDERVLIYYNNTEIFDSVPRIISLQGKYLRCITKEEDFCDLNKGEEIIRPFVGCVVADFYCANWYLNRAIKGYRRILRRDECLIAVSPVSTETELRAMKDWYKRWYTRVSQLKFEPICFLNGIERCDGIIISVRSSMVEITLVKENKIKAYWWKYHYLSEGISFDNHLEPISLYENILSVTENFKCEYEELPIYFTSYKSILNIKPNDILKFNINTINYDEFCHSIIRGLNKCDCTI